MTVEKVPNPVADLSGYLLHLVRNDPARVPSAVKDVLVALHAVALESVNVSPVPDLFEAGKSLARIDDAGIEIVVAVRELLGVAGDKQADADLARIEALIATLPPPRQGSGWLPAALVRSPASAYAGFGGGA
jgi:hypothetical protein